MKATILVLAIAAVFASVSAGASQTFHRSSDDSGVVVHAVPGQLTRAERAALDRVEEAAGDPGWIYRGGEAGWEPRSHAYEWKAGRIIHADPYRHDTPRPKVGARDSEAERDLDRN